MKLKLRLVFDDDERQALIEFQDQINAHGPTLTLEEIGKRAIFYAVMDSRRRAQELVNEAAKQKENLSGITGSSNTEIPATEVPDSKDAGTDSLANTETGGDTATSPTGN